ncbi:DgyrCDS11882 [Dimorphilus gyrociliatus]|uniref:DgyrCDS11882 n=1 Tax=Dimorphilus gyrociliatus TaxID=2664684 RepID=A0A7I8W623_9ANNE|nr:DgyrCDS11882 [Dimorphilus gyrociliatus]
MNFGSKYVYFYDGSDSEEVDEDTFEMGVNSSSDEEVEKRQTKSFFGFVKKPLAKVAKFRKGSEGKAGKLHKRVRKADTNIISVGFQELVAPNYMHTGDATRCKSCTGILNKMSTVEDLNEFEKKWICEFCSTENILNIVDEEIPQNNDTTYMLQPAPSTAQMTVDGDASIVIFCIDISGSMCVTKEVPGKLKFRGDDTSQLESFMDHPREPQLLPNEKNNVTWVSRLQGVQAAIDSQLSDMEAKHPKRRVALVTFNNEVTLVGDKPGETVHISGDKLSDSDALFNIGKEFPEPDSIKNKHKQLCKALFELEANGRTALGPALMTSIGLASKSPRSKIILCTDGKANIGCGSVEEEKDLKESSQFYEKVSTLARDMGIAISVITIEGTDCNLSQIGRVAHETEGDVNIVDPLKLSEEFSNILAVPIIATNVKATLLLHNELYFRYETNQESRVEKVFGNVTKETEITFEYGVKPGARKFKEKVDGKDSNMEKKLPFQLQIEYTDTEEARALRVITEFKPITMEREKAESKIRWSTVGSHLPQQSSKFALQSSPEKARLSNISYLRMMNRNKSTNRDAYVNCKEFCKPVDDACLELCHAGRPATDTQTNVLLGAKKFKRFWKKKDETSKKFAGDSNHSSDEDREDPKKPDEGGASGSK